MEYSTHENLICQFFSKIFIPSEIVGNNSNDLELLEIINDDKAQGALVDAHEESIRRISIPKIYNKGDMEPPFNWNTSSTNNSDYGVVDSKTTIISSSCHPVFTTTSQNVPMKDLNENESKLMKKALREEIDHTFNKNGIMRVLRSGLDLKCKI